MSFTGNVSAVIGGDLARSLGRKGTVSDVTLYNHKMEDTVLAFVEPSSYPEKIQSLLTSLEMCDQAVLKVSKIDAVFAETLVALDALDVRKGFLVLGAGVSPGDISSLISGTVASDYPVAEEQVVPLREKMAQLRPGTEGDTVVQVDHSFSVKGVGTVALGSVKKGVVRRHDELTVYPSGLTAHVRSVQVHDVDVGEASCGLRVGIALKNLKPEEVQRGSILSSGKVPVSDSLKVKAALSRYSSRNLSAGDSFLIESSLNYVPAKVLEGSLQPGKEGTLALKLDRPVPLARDRVVFLDPGMKMPRVLGCGVL
ncbi:MAG: hypothetical protein JW724_04055 [Candidatus Altiarchaeota archaeon]|nr:hypothetical protein [Candidatus Altiarchaeota archaeon]